jgi:hypothetical protein
MFEFPRAATDSTGVPGGCSGQEAAAQACWPIHTGRSWWAHHRIFTGWLNVSSDGTAVYAPHNSKRVCAPPRKNCRWSGSSRSTGRGRLAGSGPQTRPVATLGSEALG